MEEIVKAKCGVKDEELGTSHQMMMQTHQTLYYNDPQNTMDNYFRMTPHKWPPSIQVNKKAPAEKPGSRYVATHEPSLQLEKKKPAEKKA